MKKVAFTLLLHLSLISNSQFLNPQPFSISYYGEFITHPGLKIGLDYEIKHWEKNRTRKKKESLINQNSILLSPTIGFYSHRAYQTGLFILPEMCYNREKLNGNFFQAGIGFGYMRTFLPDTYRLNELGEIEKIHAGYNYFVSTGFVTFGRQIKAIKKLQLAVFTKPQVMYAAPNYLGGIFYFNLEIGLKFEF